MFTLVTERGRYFRVKRGQSSAEIFKELQIPVNDAVFAGEILAVPQTGFSVYRACVGDTYKSVALKFGVDCETLKNLNACRPVYPTCKIFVPKG